MSTTTCYTAFLISTKREQPAHDVSINLIFFFTMISCIPCMCDCVEHDNLIRELD